MQVKQRIARRRSRILHKTADIDMDRGVDGVQKRIRTKDQHLINRFGQDDIDIFFPQ